MKRLIPVGFYSELVRDSDEKRRLPSLRAAIASAATENEEKVVAYLLNGVCLGARGGYVDDVLDPSSRNPLVAHLYTDGTYLWRLDIAHYVRKHHLRLPADFIDHMESMNWQAPRKEELDFATFEV